MNVNSGSCNDRVENHDCLVSYPRERWVVIVLSKAINLGKRPALLLKFCSPYTEASCAHGTGYIWQYTELNYNTFSTFFVLDFKATDIPLYL